MLSPVSGYRRATERFRTEAIHRLVHFTPKWSWRHHHRHFRIDQHKPCLPADCPSDNRSNRYAFVSFPRPARKKTNQSASDLLLGVERKIRPLSNFSVGEIKNADDTNIQRVIRQYKSVHTVVNNHWSTCPCVEDLKFGR